MSTRDPRLLKLAAICAAIALACGALILTGCATPSAFQRPSEVYTMPVLDTGSMRPAITGNGFLRVDPTRPLASVQPGEWIVFADHYAGRLRVHRVERNENGRAITKGLSAPVDAGHVTERNYYGVATLIDLTAPDITFPANK